MLTILHNVTVDNPYTVTDYPYGGKRTSCRWWIESGTNKTTKHQKRVCQQTLNPKTQAWNKPATGIYSDFMVLYLDENNHCKSWGLSFASFSYFIAFVTSGLYHQLNEEEVKEFKKLVHLCNAFYKGINSKYLDMISLARNNMSAVEIFEVVKDKYEYIYEKDCQEVFNMVAVEKKLGKEADLA